LRSTTAAVAVAAVRLGQAHGSGQTFLEHRQQRGQQARRGGEVQLLAEAQQAQRVERPSALRRATTQC
jgi:hypothetical protein